MTLSQIQKDFLANIFFRLEAFAGWRNIAYKLLEGGECVVSGDTCIWKGGIGNFITVSDEPNFIGCVKYQFNLENFLLSAYAQEVISSEVELKEMQVDKIKQAYTELCELVK